MSYVFDNGPLSALFRNYYRNTFRSLWDKFDALVIDEAIVSTREVLREIEDSSIETLRDWAGQNHRLFTTPRGFWSEVQRFYENRICTSLPSSLSIA